MLLHSHSEKNYEEGIAKGKLESAQIVFKTLTLACANRVWQGNSFGCFEYGTSSCNFELPNTGYSTIRYDYFSVNNASAAIEISSDSTSWESMIPSTEYDVSEFATVFIRAINTNNEKGFNGGTDHNNYGQITIHNLVVK